MKKDNSKFILIWIICMIMVGFLWNAVLYVHLVSHIDRSTEQLYQKLDKIDNEYEK